MIKVRRAQWYGWKRDQLDPRDHIFAPMAVRLPGKVDLRAHMPKVYDQGDLGSCTANAIGAAIQYERARGGQRDFVPSRLFIYYQERVIEGDVAEDNGAEIRDGIKAVHKLGAPDEKLWPYVIKKFADKPPAKAYRAALADLVESYERVTHSMPAIKAALAQGFPIAFGFSVYESFESKAVAKSGVVNLPARGEEMVGGHAVLAVGYDDKTERVLVRNSWGAGWGLKGYFTMPYSYIASAKLASDFWIIKKVA